MASTRTTSFLFDEIASFFASAPSQQEILRYRPSAKAQQRSSELIEQARNHELSDELRQELDQFEQAELLMRLVKARIRSVSDLGSE
jgi:hypothetical protein